MSARLLLLLFDIGFWFLLFGLHQSLGIRNVEMCVAKMSFIAFFCKFYNGGISFLECSGNMKSQEISCKGRLTYLQRKFEGPTMV